MTVEDDVLGFVCGAEGSADPVAATLSWLAASIKTLSDYGSLPEGFLAS